MKKVSSFLFFMIVSMLSLSQSVAINGAVLTPLEREYLYLVNKNDALDSVNKELLKMIDSLKSLVLETSSQRSPSNLFLSVPTCADLVELGTNIKMLNVYRTPHLFYLTVGVPLINNKITIEPHFSDFYTEDYEFYYRRINSMNRCTEKKENSSLFIED